MRCVKTGIAGALSIAFTANIFAADQRPKPAAVKAITQKVADWQIATFEDMGTYRALPAGEHKKWHHRNQYHDLEWHCGALYAGMYEWSTIADQPEKYTDWLTAIGARNDWKLHRRLKHADDHCVGQFYLKLYEQFKDPAMLAPTRAQFDTILGDPGKGMQWYWADALFMAPPVWAHLYKVTGDQKYLDFLDREYHKTYNMLWDEPEQLFFRDNKYKKMHEANGQKVFWSRGNGWVFGGLSLLIPDLPQDWAGRAFYTDLFRDLADTLVRTQRPDGTWSMGMLGGVDGYPVKEISGSCFFVFGLARGINEGWLDRATYEPTLLKGWHAIAACVRDDGLVGYVQPVGAAPGDSFADYTEVYGTGAFLAAGTEMYKLVSDQ